MLITDCCGDEVEGMFQRNDDEPSGKETQTSGDEDLWFTKPPPESTDMPENMNNEAMGKGEERDQVMPSARGTMEWEIARKKRSSSRLLLLRHPAIESKVLATERLRRPRPSQRLRCFNRIEDGSAGDG
ncbi:hypothetical protein E2P81_ATG00496 [Venturia nashicola]|nr:hypothetical protein E2P81_ATG00496 [Venturia nashicola]